MTVIFRDFINYSKDCLNLILKPAWKLFNFHLPAFTENLCYGKPITSIQNEEEKEKDQEGGDNVDRGYESDDGEVELYGIEGMTL